MNREERKEYISVHDGLSTARCFERCPRDDTRENSLKNGLFYAHTIHADKKTHPMTRSYCIKKKFMPRLMITLT